MAHRLSDSRETILSFLPPQQERLSGSRINPSLDPHHACVKFLSSAWSSSCLEPATCLYHRESSSSPSLFCWHQPAALISGSLHAHIQRAAFPPGPPPKKTPEQAGCSRSLWSWQDLTSATGSGQYQNGRSWTVLLWGFCALH